MRSYRIQQGEEGPELIPRHLSCFIEIVDQGHQSRDAGIVFQVLIIVRNLFDGLVHLRFQFFGIAFLVRHQLLQLPDTVQEAAAALHALLAPGSAQVKSADEHLIGTQGIRAEVVHDVVRIHHVSAGFAHLFAVFSQNHAVGGSLLIGFRAGYHALVIQEAVPETGIQKMQGGMLHSAVVPVYRQPVF